MGKVDRFHIFRCDREGAVVWQEAAQTLEHARARVQILAESTPGAFIVFNPLTGQKISIGKYGDAAPANKSVA